MTGPQNRRSPGGDPGSDQSIELAGIDQTDRSAHDPRWCATCCGVQPWTETRRIEAATQAACSGRRITHLSPVVEVLV